VTEEPIFGKNIKYNTEERFDKTGQIFQCAYGPAIEVLRQKYA
jgi:hypothetical protein